MKVRLPLVDRFMSFDITDDPDPEIAGPVPDLGEYTGSAAPGKPGN